MAAIIGEHLLLSHFVKQNNFGLLDRPHNLGKPVLGGRLRAIARERVWLLEKAPA
jgi:hypothetical protein